MDYKHTVWASEILAQQKPDGSWGQFHSLSVPTKATPLTTEQALRRLWILGYTKEDAPIRRALRYMQVNLAIKAPTVFHEQKHDSKLYGDTMLATWLRLFRSTDAHALAVAKQWAAILEAAFADGSYAHPAYVEAYEVTFHKKLNPKAGCLASFVVFYQLSLARPLLTEQTQQRVLHYVLQAPRGIVYLYNKPLQKLPQTFASKQASRYLAAIELLATYKTAPQQLQFVTNWILQNKKQDGKWDMGSAAKDGIYLPLSDSWKNPDNRIADCTNRIQRLLQQLGTQL